MPLSESQRQALDAVKVGKNVFITGSAGTGKSHLISKITKWLRTKAKTYRLTASTGIAALNIGGMTLHRMVGLGLAKEEKGKLLSKTSMNRQLVRLWTQLEVLIIDEISMVDIGFFQKVEYVARNIRGKEEPFGGIQLVVIGDFFQLKSIGKGEKGEEYLFETKLWKELNFQPILLTQIFRQRDQDFIELLEQARYGKVTEEGYKKLEACKRKLTCSIPPILLFPTNDMVNMTNKEELDKLPGEYKKYYATQAIHSGGEIAKKILADIESSHPVGNELELKVGALVMCVVNLPLHQLCNGSRGKVIEFDELDHPIVEFDNVVVTMTPYTWNIEVENLFHVSYIQIPLRLAWSISIHKCITEDTLLYTEYGMIRIKDLAYLNQEKNTTEDLNIKVYSEKGVKQATHIWKGDIEEGIRVTTQLGYTLEGSNRHPIRVCNEKGEHSWKKLPELKVGDTVVLKTGIGCEGDYVYINIGDGTYPKIVNEDVCYLMGLLVGDGHYSGNNARDPYRIEITGIDVDILQEFQRILREQFGIKKEIKAIPKKKTPTFRIYFSSKMVKDFLLACGFESVVGKYKKIPWAVFNNKMSCQAAFLKGLLDTDGGVNFNVHFTTTSKQLGIDVHNLLLNFGIISNKSILREKEGNWSKAYRITISGHYARLYHTHIGFRCQRKQEKLTKQYGSYDKGTIKAQVGEIPNGKELITQLREEISNYMLSQGQRKRLPSYEDGKTFSCFLSRIIRGEILLRQVHLEYIINTVDRINKYEAGKKLLDIYENKFFYDTIKNLKVVKKQMYDIYVPDEHSFVANGFVNHNSQGLTLRNLVIDLGPRIFSPGQAYVALSRAENLETLRIISLKKESIFTDQKVIDFYNNL